MSNRNNKRNNQHFSDLSKSSENISLNYNGLNLYHKSNFDNNFGRKNSINRLDRPKFNNYNDYNSTHSICSLINNSQKSRSTNCLSNYSFDDNNYNNYKNNINDDNLEFHSRSNSTNSLYSLINNLEKTRSTTSIDKYFLDNKNCNNYINNVNDDNDLEIYSRSNSFKHSTKYNNNYSISKCENCQKLISQNVIARSEIRKLNKENESKINKYETELIKYKIKVNKYKSASKKLKHKDMESEYDYKYLQNENEKLEKQINNLESENKILNNLQIENENLKLQIKKYELGNVLYKSENENLKHKNMESERQNKNLQNEIEKLRKQNNNLHNSQIDNGNMKSKLIMNQNDGDNFLVENNKFQNKIKSKANQKNDKSKNQLNSSYFEFKQLDLTCDKSGLIIKKIDKNGEANMIPIGFDNPKGYCFVNCVVQQIFSCKDFRNQLIQFHNSSQIVNSNADDEKKIFVNNFCKLMDVINTRNEKQIQNCVLSIQRFFENSSSGDDVHKCFMNILTVVSDVTKERNNIRESATIATTPRESYELYRNQHKGFVFDLFYGQIAIKLVCTKCNFELNKRFQLFKSIPLPVPKSTEIITLENVINNYLEGSYVDTDDKMNCQCSGGSKNLYSITEFTHMPPYLFIYLNRGSCFKNGVKNNTFINCNEILTFPTGESSTKYRLISVIDHIGDNYGGHYYAKSCFESDQWWELKDSFVNLIEDKKSIVSKQAIVFLFKKY